MIKSRCVAALLGLFLFAHFAQAQSPNIILMMADDMGWGDVGFNGNKIIHTPHLDAMAENSLRFDRFYAASAVCSPTRGSCLTGRHPSRYGITNANAGHLPAQEITIQSLLKSQGYATGHFGKWHLGTLTKTEKDANRGGPGGAAHYAPPWERGFDVTFSTESKVPTWDPMWKPKTAKGNTWWDPSPLKSDPRETSNPFGTAYWSNGDKVAGDLRGDDSKIIMDQALSFIEKSVKENKPSFTVIWFHAPHLPVVAGTDHTAIYKDKDSYTQHHHGSITALDEQVGRLRAQLRQMKIADDTMIWFCSDNGPEGNDKAPGSSGGLRGRKRDLYEGGVRVPALLEWPAMIKSARSTSMPACTSDYLPTIVEVLSLKLPEARPIDGVSLLPLIKDEMKTRPLPIAFEFQGKAALSDNQYKLVLPVAAITDQNKGKNKAADRVMLFDLLNDRAEANDISQQYPEIVAKMKERLVQWRASCRRSSEGLDYQ